MSVSLTTTGKIFHDICRDRITESWTCDEAVGTIKFSGDDAWRWSGRSDNKDFIYKTWSVAKTTFVLNYFMSSDQGGGISHFSPRAFISEAPTLGTESLFWDYGTSDATAYKHRLGYYKASPSGVTAFTGSPYSPGSAAYFPYKWTVAGANIGVYCNRSLFDSKTDLRTEGMKRLEFGVDSTSQLFGVNAYPLVAYKDVVLCTSNDITVTGLGASSGRKVKLYRGAGTLVATSGAADGSGNVTFDAVDFQFGEWGFLAITDTDGTTIVDWSDSMKIYGGSTYAWTFADASTTFRITNHDSGIHGDITLHVPLVNASLDHYHIERSPSSGGTFLNVNSFTDNVGTDYTPGGGLILDQSHVPASLGSTIDISGTQSVGMSFTPAITGTLKGFAVPVLWVSGAADIMAWRLYAADADGYPTGSELASEAWYTAGDLYTQTSYKYFGFSAPATVTSGTKYVIYFERASGSVGVTWRWQYLAADTTFSGGEGVKYSSGSWSAVGVDLPIKTYISTSGGWGTTHYFKVVAHDSSHSVLGTTAEYPVTSNINKMSCNNEDAEMQYSALMENYGKVVSGNVVLDETKSSEHGFYPMLYACGFLVGNKMYNGSLYSGAQLLTAAENQGAYAMSAVFNDTYDYGKLFKRMYTTPTSYDREANARNGWAAFAFYQLSGDTDYLQYAVDIAKGMVNYFERADYTYNSVTKKIFYSSFTIETPPFTASIQSADPNQNWQIAALFTNLYYEDNVINPFYKGTSTNVDNPMSYAYWSGKTYAQAAADIINEEMDMGWSMQESSGKYRIRLESNTFPNTSDTGYGRYGLCFVYWLLRVANSTDFASYTTWETKLDNSIDNWLSLYTEGPAWSGPGYLGQAGIFEAAMSVPLNYRASFANRVSFVDNFMFSRAINTATGTRGGYRPEVATEVTNAAEATITMAHYILPYIITPEALADLMGGRGDLLLLGVGS